MRLASLDVHFVYTFNWTFITYYKLARFWSRLLSKVIKFVILGIVARPHSRCPISFMELVLVVEESSPFQSMKNLGVESYLWTMLWYHFQWWFQEVAHIEQTRDMFIWMWHIVHLVHFITPHLAHIKNCHSQHTLSKIIETSKWTILHNRFMNHGIYNLTRDLISLNGRRMTSWFFILPIQRSNVWC